MKTIGLVGGVASGKSLAGRMLVDLGAGLLDADRTGHDVLADDAEVLAALRGRWGDAVFAADGNVNRSAVAARVFGAGADVEANRHFLEGVLHPRIRRRLETLRDQFAVEGKPAVVLDAPLLLEAGWWPMCDIVLMIDAPREERLARARQRGWSEAEFAQREAAQMPIDEKRRAAHVVIVNDGSADRLRQCMRLFWRHYVEPAPSK